MFKKVYIEITNVCNLKCKFCPETNRKKEFIKLENFENIINKIKKYTNLVCLHVKGEPLLHPDLKEILNILSNNNLKVNITTNGTLVKDKLNILKESSSLRQINISLHSINQNKIFDRDYLRKIFESVDEMDNIFISYRLWNLNNIIENDVNYNIINELESYYNLTDLKDNLKKNNYIKIRDNIFINQDLEFEWPNVNGNNINKKGRCLALKEQIAILVDGTVVPCCLDNNGDIKLGNIYKESLEDILNKELSVKIKRNFENNIITCNLCKTCGFLKRLESKRN